MKKHKLHSLLIVLLMVLQVFASPLVALAQEAATSASPATEAVQPATENAANGEEGKEDTAQEGDAEADAQAGHFPQAQVQPSQYEMTTKFTINTHPVQKNGKYGEGKFYITPTYKIPNKVTLKNGDTLTYTVPNVFQVEATGVTEVSAGGEVVGNVVVDPATNTATLTITNEAYFAKLNEEKTLTMSFTAVWADSVPKNVVQNFTMPGAGDYALTRIVVDEDPTGYTKWGVQNKDNPELIDWRIRINRYAKAGVTNAVIKDAIPEGQEFVGEMTGYYFTDWENGTRVDSFAGTTITNEDDNNFTVIPNKGGSLDGRGLYLIYQTRITEPVDPVTKRATNHVSFTSDTDKQEFDGFAPLKTTDGVGTGARSDLVVFQVNKKLEGRQLKAQEFEFQLVKAADNSVVATAKNDENGLVKFKKVKFKTEGEFIYKIREVKGDLPGVTYDENEITATVKVTNKAGAKTAEVTYDREAFTNTYKAAATSLVVKASKKLAGATLAADQFTFELVDKATGEVVATAKNKADGSVDFPALNYDAAGAHTYTIREKNEGAAGYTYDSKTFEVTVDVTDNGQGQLVATPTYAAPAEFSNSYQAAATSLVLKTSKKLAGATLAADQFTFELVDKATGEVVATAKNKADGSVDFPALNYDAAGNHTYTIREVNNQKPGYTYDDKTLEVTVAVTDNGQGQLVANASYSSEEGFTNTYKAAATSLVVKASKKLAGATLAADQFTFELVDKATGEVVATAKNKADGSVDFPALNYDAAGNHTYTIREVNDQKPGYSYDDKTLEVTVAVTDNGQGQLEAKATYASEEGFANTYKAAATSLVVKASKKLAGATLAADQFTFELVDKDGKVVGTAKNKADGSVEFPALSFDAAGDYSFKIREKNEGAAGYTYDASEFDLAVAVTDNGQGQLEAKASYAKPAEFSNSYKAGTASLVVDAKTVIKKGPKEEDVPVKKDQFTLELVDKDGKVLHSLKNDENGKVVFPALTFDAAGQYTYTLRQVKGSEAGMTYDDKIYTVKVIVSDNGQGQLLVQAENATGVVFVNRLAETSQTEDPGKDPGKKEEKQLPKTGEASSILLIGLGFVLAIAAGLVVRREQVKN